MGQKETKKMDGDLEKRIRNLNSLLPKMQGNGLLMTAADILSAPLLSPLLCARCGLSWIFLFCLSLSLSLSLGSF